MLRIIRHAHRELASDTVTARKEFHSLPFYSAVSCTRARTCAERGVTVRVRGQLFLSAPVRLSFFSKKKKKRRTIKLKTLHCQGLQNVVYDVKVDLVRSFCA